MKLNNPYANSLFLKKRLFDFIFYLLFCFFLCPSYYQAVTKIDIYDSGFGGINGDAAQYVKMVEQDNLDGIWKPFRYRVLVPYLVKIISFDNLLQNVQSLEIDREKLIKLRFAFINLLSAALVALLLLRFCIYLGFNLTFSFIAGLLYVTNYFVTNIYSIPTVDGVGSLFLLIGFIAIVKNQYSLLFFVTLLGMFAKESLSLLFFYSCLWISPFYGYMKKKKLLKILLTGIGVLPYLYFRNLMIPTDIGYKQFSFSTIWENMLHLFQSLTIELSSIIDIFWMGSLIGSLGFIGLYFINKKDNRFSPPPNLKELTCFFWIFLILIPVPALLGVSTSSSSKQYFLSFPFMIPFATYSLQIFFQRLTKYIY